jgi:hypothetical protein
MRCVIPITTNSFRNMGEHKHLRWNCMISPKRNTLCCLWYVIFRKVFRDPLLPIQVPYGEAYGCVAMKKTSLTPCLEGKVLMVLHLPRHIIGSQRCRGHHDTLTVWLCDVVDMRCSIPIKVNSFHNMGGPRHLWQKLHYFTKTNATLLPMISYF